MKILLPVLAFALLIVGGLFYYMTVVEHEMETGGYLSKGSHTFEWRIEPSPRYEETMPWGNLTLVVNGSTYRVAEDLGCSPGQIITFSSPDALSENEITRMRCWFAGGGTDYSVFFEEDRYVVKKRVLSETPPGLDNEPIGPWEILFAF